MMNHFRHIDEGQGPGTRRVRTRTGFRPSPEWRHLWRFI